MEPTQGTVISLLLLLSVAALILFAVYRSRRTIGLRKRFGDTEYDRTLEHRGSRASAEADLVARKRRVAKLVLRPLDAGERRHFTNRWIAAKSRFVVNPTLAIGDADAAIGSAMAACGYPIGDFNSRYEALTVRHREVARHYRAGHDIVLKHASGEASTGDLRQAMIHFEVLFEELLAYGYMIDSSLWHGSANVASNAEAAANAPVSRKKIAALAD